MFWALLIYQGDFFMKYKPNMISVVFGALFTTISVVFLAAIIAVDVSYANFKKDAVPVEAVITDIDSHRVHNRNTNKTRTEHTVYVEYEYEGEVYNTELGYYSSGMKKGDREEIYINPDNPSESSSSPLILNCIIIPLAGIFISIGLVFLIKEVKNKKAVNKLIEDGLYVFCDDVAEENANVTVNNVRYRWLRCTYNDGTGRTFVFHSHPYPPSERHYTPGQSVKIYVDIENNPKVYYICLD